MSKTENNPGKITKLWPYLVKLHKEKPHLFDGDPGYLRAHVAQAWKALKDPSQCPNCSASMKQYVYHFDVANAAMLVAMGRTVKRRLNEAMEFNEANRIHVQTKAIKSDYREYMNHYTPSFWVEYAGVADSVL